MTENRWMVGWHHQLDGNEFEQALGVGNGHGSVAYCCPWDCKELGTTKQLKKLRKSVWAYFYQFCTSCHRSSPKFSSRISHVTFVSHPRVSL